MPLMEWDESMSVSVPKLDDQHRELIHLINTAFESIQKHDPQAVYVLLKDMQTYAIKHFAYEEGLLRRHGYPDIEAHKFQHAKFNHDVEEFRKNQFERTNLSQLFVYLSRWLTAHIMDEDMKFVPYMPKPEETA